MIARVREWVAASGAAPQAGMALGVLAYMLFAGHDTAIKWLVGGSGGHPELFAWQVLCARSAFIVVAVLLAGRGRLLARVIVTPEKPRLLLRAPILLTAWLCYYSAARELPLAQLLTLYFAAPIVTTILAGPLLGERVPASRWLAVALGFAGVVVACDPGGLPLSWATARVLLAAVLWGAAIILMRQIARRESSLLQMFYMNAVFLVATGTASVARSATPDLAQWPVLLVVGVFGAAGQWCLFEGARRAPASVMASVEYSALVWAFVLGFAVFGDVPRAPVFLGATLIAAAGAWLVWSERRAA